LHVLVLGLLLLIVDVLLHLLILHVSAQLFSVLLLHKLLPYLCFLGLTLVVFRLLFYDSSPLVNLAVLDGIVSFLIVIKILDAGGFLLVWFFDSVGVELQGVNLSERTTIINLRLSITYTVTHFYLFFFCKIKKLI